MIIGFEGGLGGGKTLGMVRYLYKDSINGYKIYSNFGLKNIKHEKVNVSEILSNKDLHNVSIGIDEMTVFLDCRKSSSKMNRLISYFILQTRKRGVNLYFTTQDFSMIDMRLMNHCHFQVVCSTMYDEKGNEIPNIKRYTIFDIRNLKNIKLRRLIIDISKYYPYYDTNEIILPPV